MYDMLQQQPLALCPRSWAQKTTYHHLVQLYLNTKEYTLSFIKRYLTLGDNLLQENQTVWNYQNCFLLLQNSFVFFLANLCVMYRVGNNTDQDYKVNIINTVMIYL